MESSDRKELRAQWKTEVQVPTLQAQDVAKHSSKDDLWMTIHGKVYDVTSYLRDHPGGAEALLEVGGKDATSAYEDVGHSEDAREIMHPFLVGVLDGAKNESRVNKTAMQTVRRGPAKAAEGNKRKSGVSGVLTPERELAIGCFSGVALLWIFWATGALSQLSSWTHSSHRPHGSSFMSGFLWASAVVGVTNLAVYRRLSKVMDTEAPYTRLPARISTENAVLSTNRPAGVLIPQEYQAFPLIRRDLLSADVYRLVFGLPTRTSVLGLPIGQHVSIRGFFDDQEGHHTVSRSYTPVSNNRDLGRLELVIKLYPDGQLTGKYLSRLQIGDKVEFRGPKGAMRYRKGMSRRLGMIAGGTGITPMYQLIRAICEDKTDETTVSLIFANKSPADILLQTQLERFKEMAPTKLTITYVIDKTIQGWTGEVGYVNTKMMQEKLPQPDKETKILLCGPPGMVNAAKKGLVELGFEAPGAVSKMSDQIFLF